MSNEQGSARLKILDTLIIIGIVVCITFAGVSYYYKEPITYSATQTTHSKALNTTTWEVSYNFTSEVFSAQSTIKISAIARLTDEYLEKRPNDTKPVQLFIYLPTASSVEPIYENGRILNEFIKLTDENVDGLFKGNTTVIYQSEGDKCVILKEQPMEKSFGCDDEDDPIIHISSADSLFQLRNSRTTLALTWIFLAFTIIVIRDFFKGVGYNLWLLKKNKNEKQTRNKPK